MAVQLHTFLKQVHLRLLSMALIGVFTVNMALAEDKYCLDYFTVGDSKCQAKDSTPVSRQSAPTTKTPQLVSPPNDVDNFLANYGKPPREFVEFYLHPTSENAAKWAAAYQQIVQKGKDISKAWNQADQLNQSTTSSQLPAQPSLGGNPAPLAPAVAQQPAPAAPALSSFGGLAAANLPLATGAGGVRTTPTSLTYYFSQVCPYCARTTPDLAVISKNKESTLTFTCVDVTPVGAQSRPDEAFITSKLPCKWRLPEEGEVEKQDIRLTPTLIIQREGSAPVRLSGYVPLAQLRQYF